MRHQWKWYEFGDGVQIALCKVCQRQATIQRESEICDGVIRSNTTKARKASDVSRHMQKNRVGECSN